MTETAEKKRPSKKRFAFIVSVVALLAAGGVCVSIWQRNNISAVRTLLNAKPADISAQLADNEQRIADSVAKALPEHPVPDLTDQEKKALAEDTITPQEAAQLLLDRAYAGGYAQNAGRAADSAANTGGTTATGGQPAGGVAQTVTTGGGAAQTAVTGGVAPQTTAAGGGAAQTVTAASGARSGAKDSAAGNGAKDITAGSGANNSVTPPNSTVGQDAAQTRGDDPGTAYIAEAIARIYVLRAQFTNQLNGLLSSAKAEYKALSPAEHTTAKQAEIGMKYLKAGGALESDCDAQMNGIVSELRANLKQAGEDTSICAEIMDEYTKEKSLQKAYYLSLYTSK